MSAAVTRPPAIFSETVAPHRALAIHHSGETLGLCTVRARHLLGGSLVGYFVEFDDGTRMTLAPGELRNPENIVAPPPSVWNRPTLGAAS